jgi:hypothetical protein
MSITSLCPGVAGLLWQCFSNVSNIEKKTSKSFNNTEAEKLYICEAKRTWLYQKLTMAK